MSEHAEKVQQQLDRMTVRQIRQSIQRNQEEMDILLEQLFARASVQGYTEQQYNELLALHQEVVSFLEAVPVTPEWEERRDELLARLSQQL